VYRTGGVSGGVVDSRLTWVDRHGKQLEVIGSPSPYATVDFAHDVGRAAVTITPSVNSDVWLVDMNRGGVSTRLTSGPTADRAPVWSPDGSRIVFQSQRNGPYDLYVRASNGAGGEDLLVKSDVDKMATSWSRDGRFLLFDARTPKSAVDL
jgi:Tol biopolymer transport system component